MGTAIYYGVARQSDNLTVQGNPSAGASGVGGWAIRVKNSGGIVIDDPGPAGYNDIAHGFFAGAWQLLLPDPNGPVWQKGMPWGLLGDTQGREVSTYSSLSKAAFYFSNGLQWDTVL